MKSTCMDMLLYRILIDTVESHSNRVDHDTEHFVPVPVDRLEDGYNRATVRWCGTVRIVCVCICMMCERRQVPIHSSQFLYLCMAVSKRNYKKKCRVMTPLPHLITLIYIRMMITAATIPMVIVCSHPPPPPPPPQYQHPHREPR